MDKESPTSGAPEAEPFFQAMEDRINGYRPLAKMLLAHLPDLQLLERRLRRAVRGEEVYSLDLAEELRRARILLEEVDDIFSHATPPKDTRFREAVAKTINNLQKARGDIPLSGNTKQVTLTVLGWETLNYKWNMILDIPVEFIDGEELDEEFTDALDDAREGLTGNVWSTDGTEHEECEVTYEVDHNQGDDA